MADQSGQKSRTPNVQMGSHLISMASQHLAYIVMFCFWLQYYVSHVAYSFQQ